MLTLISILAIICKLSTSATVQLYKADQDPFINICDGNPFKGFYTSPNWGITTNFPLTLEFYYISLKDVMTNLDTFTWSTGLEPMLQATAGRNRHAVIRFFLDYPGAATGVPQFLIDGGLSFNSYTEYDGGESPDYSDANLKSALLNFIAGLGAAYDGDSRIAVIQLGLLGFWGEWHTYPHESWEVWDINAIMNAFDTAFSVTQLNVRYPSNDSIAYRLGYHDDSFLYATVDISGSTVGSSDNDWFFYSRLVIEVATDKWQSNIIGGEVYPDLQSTAFSSDYTSTEYSQNWYLCNNLTHASYMLNAWAYDSNDTGYDTTNGEYDDALAAHRSLGYYIWLERVNYLINHSSLDETLDITMGVNIVNDGIAPFYYDLRLIVELKNSDGTFVTTWDDTTKNSLSKDVLGANTNLQMNDIVFSWTEQELLDNFGDVTTGQFSTVLSITFKLVSSMVYSGNPVRFCNVETDTSANIGAVTLLDEIDLSGTIDVSSPNPSPTKAPVTENKNTDAPTEAPVAENANGNSNYAKSYDYFAAFMMLVAQFLLK